MVARTITVIILIFFVLIVVLPALLTLIGVPIGSGGGGGGTSVGTGTLKNGILLRSADAGETWQAVEFSADRPHPSAVNDIAFDPRDINIVFAATTGSGLWKSTDDGATWKKVNDHNNVLQARSDVYKITIAPTRPDVIYLAVVQNKRGRVLRSEDGGASFQEIYSVTRNGFGVFDVYTPPSFPDRVEIATGEGRLLVSDDAGRRWRMIKIFGESLAVLAVNPAYSGEQYAITSLGVMAKTFDSGATWVDLGAPTENVPGSAGQELNINPYAGWQLSFSSTAPSLSFAIDPLNPAMLYFTRGDELLSSANGGFSWRKVTTLITGQGVMLGGIAVHPTKSGGLALTAGPDFYQSTDQGESWRVRTVSAGPPLKKIFMRVRRPETILITTGK